MILNVRLSDKNIFKVVGGGLTLYKLLIEGGLVGNPESEIFCRGFVHEDVLWLIEKDFRDGFNNFIKSSGRDDWERKYGHITPNLITRMQSNRKTINKDHNYDLTAVKQGVPECSRFPNGNFMCIEFSSANDIASIYDGLVLHYEEVVEEDTPPVSKAKNSKNEPFKISVDISTYISMQLKDGDLIELFNGYLDIRKQKRLPVTELTVKLLINRLREVSGNDVEVACRVVTQAILRGWKTFYPVKD